MSNKYESVVRLFTARNLYEGVLNPPNVFSIDPLNGVFRIPVNSIESEGCTNRNSNIQIRKVGVFSNFADGLVFAYPWQLLGLYIDINLYSLALGGDITTVNNDKNVTGTNFNVLNSDNLIRILDAFSDYNYQVVDTVTDANTMSLFTYPYFDGVDQLWNRMIPGAAGAAHFMYKIRELNTMYDVDFNYNPADYTGVPALDFYPVIRVGLNPNTVYNTDPLISFLTNTIDTSYVNAKVHFDVKMEVEYTK